MAANSSRGTEFTSLLCTAVTYAVTAAADSEGHLQIWRLLGALARTPGELGPLLRLAGRYRAANRSLAAVARVGVA